MQEVPARAALAQAAGILQTVEVTRGFALSLNGWTQVRGSRQQLQCGRAALFQTGLYACLC